MLSIILVHYKSNELLMNCLQSIFQFDTARFEIIVVDNDSKDNVEELLTKSYPSVRFVQMGYNAGFARANNAGIRQSTGEVLLLLNTDTLLKEDAINACLNDFIHTEAAACGVQLLNEDGTPQIAGNYAMKGGLNYLLPLPYWGNFLKKIAEVLKVSKPHVPNVSTVAEVDWINGAFLMVRQSAIEKAGLLDEDFFLYAEEAEWCSRLKKSGKLLILGKHHVYHLQGKTANMAFESTGQGYYNLYDQKGLQIMVSNFLRIRKEFGIGWMLFSELNYLLVIPIFLIGVLLSKIWPLQSTNRYAFKDWVGYCDNVAKLISLTPRILLNRPHFYKFL